MLNKKFSKMKEKILELFYKQKCTQKEIAEKLKLTKSYVSQIVTKDERYPDFKKEKLKNNKKKHNMQIQKIVEQKRKKEKFNRAVDNSILRVMHEQAVNELSKRKHLSDESYREWNSSAYKYNALKRRYEFDDNLGRSADVPKYIKVR